MPLLFVGKGGFRFCFGPSQEGHTLELFSRDGGVPTRSFYLLMKPNVGRKVPFFANFPFPLFFKAHWKRRDWQRRESKTVQRLRGEVSVIRNLGYNYKIARRKKHGGGISLWSTITNEFSLFLMEKSHICKIKSQCLCDERICWLCHPFFKDRVLGKTSEEAKPLVKGVGAEQAAGFYPLVQG